MNTALIILPIPSDIPMPRYRLFQRVEFDNEVEQGAGQITGLEWDAETGWSYRVNIGGAAEPAQVFLEEEIELIRGGAS